MKEMYRTMMKKQTLSCEAREEFAQKLERRSARVRQPWRIAVAAACFCAVLAGSAWAVNYVAEENTNYPVTPSRQVTLTDRISGVEQSSFRIQSALPLDAGENLSEAVRADMAAGTLVQSFEDADGLQTYMGVSLASNPILDSAPIVSDFVYNFVNGWRLCPELEEDAASRYRLIGMNCDGTETDTNPDLLCVTFHRVVDNAEVYIRAYIPTAGADSVPENGMPGEVCRPEPRVDNRLILGENGEFSWQSEFYMSAEYNFFERAYPMENGAEAALVTMRQPDMDTGGEHVGYFVYDGILYRVWPYAVNDPDQETPDMLNVLCRVLDAFE